MKPRTKSFFFILGTLLIGMLLGALLHARIMDRRMERIAYLRTAQGFTGFFERAIGPQEPAQREAVRAILDRSAERVGAAAARRRTEMRTIIDATVTELSEVLNAEQMAALEENLKRRKEEWRARKGHRMEHPSKPAATRGSQAEH